MFFEKWLTEKQYRHLAFLLFGIIFIYLFIRSFTVSFMHDEVATFFHYIETGIFVGKKSMTDANNHLLNSILGHFLYKLFGDNPFVLRLPNLLSFPLYFWATWQLIKPFKIPIYRLLVLLGVVCIPFIVEYFAYCRGYGISIAFFMASLVFLSRLANDFKHKNLVLVFLCLWMAVYANLTYLVSSVLAAIFIILQLYRQKNKLTKRIQIKHLLLLCLFGLSLFPAAVYARILKNGGALYYGRLDGLWEVTGTSLSQYTLFTATSLLKWIFVVLGLLFVVLLIKRWLHLRFFAFFTENSTLIAWFLFGHLAVIVVIAIFMEVNYPEDRVGMYLIPLTLLLIAFVLERAPKLRFLLLGFLFFPITFFAKMNMNTSVFSPDDRMTETFYDKVYAELKTEKTSLSLYHLMRLTWSRHNRKDNKLFFAATAVQPNTASDLFLSRENLNISASALVDFDTLFLDPSNSFIAYKRKVPFVKTIIWDSCITKKTTYDEFIGIARFKIPDSLKNIPLQVHIKGKIGVEDPRMEAVISYSVFDNTGQNVFLDSWTTRWSNGLKAEQDLLFNYPIEKWSASDDEVRIYIFNRLKTGISLKNVRIELLRLE